MHEVPLRRAAAAAAGWLASLDDRPVAVPIAPHDLRPGLAVELTEAGVDPGTVIDELAGALVPGLTASAGPRYFGFVTGGSLPVAVAADWLVSAYDQNAAMYVMSPAAAVAEEVAAGWVLDLLGLPAGSGVGFVTGAQMANFTCLAAARHALLAAAGWDVATDGLRLAPELTVLAGERAHVTLTQALRLLGLGSACVRWVPADSRGRMIAAGLRSAIGAAQGPVLVCAQAGEVNTGAFDPLREIAGLVRERPGSWLHVDGAFGLWAAASPELRSLADGAELADSWATDGHKWLNVPYDCGLAIVRDQELLTSAVGFTAAYLPGGAGRDSFSFTPESSRRARALPVYAALRSLGRQGVAGLVERCCSLARLAAAELGRCPLLEVLNEVVLNQVLLRVHGADTADVIARVQRDGTCWVGGTVWDGGPALRFSVSNWSTTAGDVRRSAQAIVAAVGAASK
jgi:glutamate/tyrosine decarboxylase-like PLP-dependent enzyme